MNPSPVRMYRSRIALYGDGDVAIGSDGLLWPNLPIFFLAGRVQNTDQRDLVIDDHLPHECI